MIKKSNDLPVILVDSGVSNNFSTYIEIHRDLVNYPQLYSAILAHEQAHAQGKNTMYDFVLDMKHNKEINQWELFKFMIARPKTWTQFLPIYYQKDKGIVYDVNKIIKTFIIFVLLVLNIMIWSYLIIQLQGRLS